jgi:hypothetical protein
VDQLVKKFDAVLVRHEKIPAKGYNDDDENKQILNEVSKSRSPFKVWMANQALDEIRPGKMGESGLGF